MRKTVFVNKEFYHIFNRGTDKRDIFSDKYDVYRFLQSLEEFNCVDTGNDIFYINRSKTNQTVGYSVPRDRRKENNDKLVNIVCYCLNPNHYHFILEQLVDGGISEFMRRLNGGYSRHFNKKYERSGVLFQGKFKAVHIKSNEQLLHTSFYVNLNNKVHQKFDKVKNHFLDLIPNRSSWNEYTKKDSKYSICGKNIVLGQFKDKKDYEKNAEEVVKGIKEKRYED